MTAQSRLAINWSDITAGALAALSGAMTASLLGVYGTLLGAAVMSVVTTVVATVSHHFLARTRVRLQQVRHTFDTDGVGGPGGRSPTRRGKALARGMVLVATTALATMAGMQVVAKAPLDSLLFGSGGGETKRTVIIKRVVTTEDPEDTASEPVPERTVVRGGEPGGGDAPAVGTARFAHDASPTPSPSTASSATAQPGTTGKSSPESSTSATTERTQTSRDPQSTSSPDASGSPSSDSTAQDSSSSAGDAQEESGDGDAGVLSSGE